MKNPYPKKASAVKRAVYLVRLAGRTMRVAASHAEMLAIWLPVVKHRKRISWQ